MLSLKSIRDLPIAEQLVLMRLDFNVPIKNGVIEDDTRIREAIPTIQHALDHRARLILCSHLGRPQGKPSKELSLEPIAHRLAELLNKEITLADDCVGDGIELLARKLGHGEVLLLENLRFHKEEEANDPGFCNRLARLLGSKGFFICDAFGTVHRKHASTVGVPQIIAQRGMGFLIEKEVKFLDRLLVEPAQPFYMVLGGAKVTEKIKTIEAMLNKVRGLAVGGQMAYAFMKAKSLSLPEGAKAPSVDDIAAAKKILSAASKRDVRVLLPMDFVESFDIGPESRAQMIEFLSEAKTIFWNGPLGWFEKPPYHEGTFEVARAVSAFSPCLKVVGGGETVAAIHASGSALGFDHLSTGGGAALEYLEHGSLPGIDVLKTPEDRFPKSSEEFTYDE